MSGGDEGIPVPVPEAAMPTGETDLKDWSWVERSFWTERMLEALEKGVKGGVWFSLVDKVYRPKTLRAAWVRVKVKKGSAGTDRQTIAQFESKLDENLEKLERKNRWEDIDGN